MPAAGAAGLPARVGERRRRRGAGSCAAAAGAHPGARPRRGRRRDARRDADARLGETIHARPALQLRLPCGEPDRPRPRQLCAQRHHRQPVRKF